MTPRQQARKKHPGAFLRRPWEWANWDRKDQAYYVMVPLSRHCDSAAQMIGKGDTAREAWQKAAEHPRLRRAYSRSKTT